MCVVPTLTFDLLFAFLVQGHGRRQLLWFEMTRHPRAEWLGRQITVPLGISASLSGARRVRAMGIRDRPISPGSPWQNGIAERLIGTLRRECLDQMRLRTSFRLSGNPTIVRRSDFGTPEFDLAPELWPLLRKLAWRRSTNFGE